MALQVETLSSWLAIVRRWCRRAGPYLLLEILLPGGTLFALSLFLYRSMQGMPVVRPRDPTLVCAVATADGRDSRLT
jgi:hypothetical protein